MSQTSTQQTDKFSELQELDVATFFKKEAMELQCNSTKYVQTVPLPNDEQPFLLNRDAQMQALREEAQRLQAVGWCTAINENTMQVEHWRPRGSFPQQSEGYLHKLGNWLQTFRLST